MIVVAHGNVDEYCAAHEMVIVRRFSGEIEEWRGPGSILVTDAPLDKNEFYYLKYRMLRWKVQLISIHWNDRDMSDFVAYLDSRRRQENHVGRMAFGFHRVGGEVVVDEAEMKVARRILELRDAGATYKAIVEDPEVRYPDGRRMGISTIQVILKNRGKYE